MREFLQLIQLVGHVLVSIAAVPWALTFTYFLFSVASGESGLRGIGPGLFLYFVGLMSIACCVISALTLAISFAVDASESTTRLFSYVNTVAWPVAVGLLALAAFNPFQ